MEILISVVGKICEYLVKPIGRRAGYLVCYNSHKKELEKEAKNLEGIQRRVGHKVDEAKRNGELIEDDVEKWHTQVDETGEEVKRFSEDEVQANKWCLGGLCPNLISRYSLGSKAKKMIDDVSALKTDGAFETISYQAPPLGIEHMATGGFVDFESRKKTMDEIMAALKDDNINAIGICGLGGTGKTTAVKEVGKRAKVENLFDEIVMAVVAQKTMETIQGQIADMLGLKFKEEGIPGRANRLRGRLMNSKRVLVILDDVWGSQNLEEVGIPFGGAHKGCKVILTSRNQDACNGMGPCQIFTIGVLSEQEAWSLFMDKAGNSIDSPDLYPTATKVVKECGALPIVIVTVGTALKDKSKEIWEDALLQLRQSCPENIPGMYEKVYQSLELSFNLLQSQEAKSCLLLCCIFEEDADIPLQDLVRFGVGLCLFKGVKDLVQATYRVHALVHTLKSYYLLLGSEKEECVKMHDVVRDVIRSIAAAGKDGLMLRHDLELEWPTESTDQLYTSTSFMSNKIQDLLLLELKEWPTESTFLPTMDRILSLENIGDSVKVPENLFEGMKEVRVLQLRRMFIPSPPPSLALLTKLQTLCIEDCNLKNISLIGELKALKILSFRGSSIQELPKETGKLTRLQSLDLTECRRLERISPGVLSSLIRLEQLYMGNCCVRWEVIEGTSERNNANVAELISLSDQLTALEINLPASSDKFFGGFKKLVRFRIMISDTPRFRFRNKHVRNELIINDSRTPFDDQLLKKTEILKFEWCSTGFKNVLNNLNRESLIQLKSLHLLCCHELEYVIDTVDLISPSIFPSVESLSIDQVRNLKMICRGQLPAESFAKLKFIELVYCNRLENVFSQSIAKGLVQLEQLFISSCEMMEEIVVMEREHEEVTSKIRLPKLRELRFWDLPSLVGFCKKMGDEIEFPQLSILDLYGLPKIRSIWPSSLGTHECDDSATATQHLLNQKVKSLCELRSIKVNHCEKLTNVFSSDSIHSLLNLEKIEIRKCDSVEVALDFVGVNIEEGRATVPLSQLKKLELSDLPKLICVWKKLPKRIHECQNLQSLKIARCSRLKNIFSPSMTKIAEQLQQLDISECEMMTEIVAEDEGDEKATDKIECLLLRHLSLSGLPNLLGLFPKDVGSAEIRLFNGKIKSLCELRSITVEYCEKLVNIFSSDLIHSLSNLEKIKISKCHLVEVALDFVGVNIEEGCVVVPLSRLMKFELSDLPRLICVWKKLPKRIHECQKLQSLKIARCSRLKNIFSPSTTKIYEQLQQLDISECEMMTEIVAEDGGDENATDKIEFLQLLDLSLSRLPNLLGFFPKDVGSALFNEKVSFPRLKELTVSYMENFGEIWCSQPPSCSFYELRVLNISNCHKILHVAPFHLLKRLQNLERVYVKSCDSMEEVVEEGYVVMLSRLETMKLESLPKLMQICKKDHNRTISFQNLKNLEVLDCGSLRNLFNPSVTRGLVHLERLWIERCVMMEEIVAKGEEQEEEGMDKIVIPKLKELILFHLQNLTSFCQSLYAFDLPLLDFLKVEDCPNMKTFSFGFANTPKLKKVRIKGFHEENLMGDLNNTIRQLFQTQKLKVNQETEPKRE